MWLGAYGDQREIREENRYIPREVGREERSRLKKERNNFF